MCKTRILLGKHRLVALKFTHDVAAIFSGHIYIENNHVGPKRFGSRKYRAGPIFFLNFVNAGLLKNCFYQPRELGIVIDNKNSVFVHCGLPTG